MKIIDYKIVSWANVDYKIFESDIKEEISNGWQPFGGICETSEGSLVQAMVKYEQV